MGGFKLPVARPRQSNYQQDQTQLTRGTMDLWLPGRRSILFVFFLQSKKHSQSGEWSEGQRRVGERDACGFPGRKNGRSDTKRDRTSGNHYSCVTFLKANGQQGTRDGRERDGKTGCATNEESRPTSLVFPSRGFRIVRRGVVVDSVKS